MNLKMLHVKYTALSVNILLRNLKNHSNHLSVGYSIR